MKTHSFTQIYENLKTKPTPCAQFVHEVANLTNRTEATVRKWIAGETRPDINVQVILEKHFDVPRDVLFPKPTKH